MDSLKQLKELSVMVNQELSNYIKVHDWIHSECETFKSSIKNLLGFGIPMDRLLKEAENLIPEWESLNRKMGEYKIREYDNLSDEERHFFNLLSEFVIALNKTVICLVARQKILAKGVNKFRSLTWNEHQRRRAAYEDAIDEYLAIGQRLNEIKHLVFK
jgi:hypothetical protein